MEEDKNLIVQIIIRKDSQGQLIYDKRVNFPDATVAAMVTLDLEAFVNSLKEGILKAASQLYRTKQQTEQEAKSKNYDSGE